MFKLFRRFWRRPSRRGLIRDRFSVGRGTYGEPKVLNFGEKATLSIGAFCSISKEVAIFLGGGHHLDWVTMYPFGELRPSARHLAGGVTSKGDVIIGNDVWIGYRPRSCRASGSATAPWLVRAPW